MVKKPVAPWRRGVTSGFGELASMKMAHGSEENGRQSAAAKFFTFLVDGSLRHAAA